MFGTYLVRELTNRKRQTAIIAIGMAVAITLVIIVNAVAIGVRDAQSSVLASVYGVGTDITISQSPAAPEEGAVGRRGPSFNFGSEDGTTADGSTSLRRTTLTAGPGTATFDASAVQTALAVDNVAAAAATLSLNNVSFSGEIPDFSAQGPRPGMGQGAPTGGADGAGGSSFGVDTFSVEGIEVAEQSVGPLSATAITSGRAFTADDAGARVAALDTAYATSAGLTIGDSIAIGDTEFEVIALLASNSAAAATTADAYIPLDIAQSLSGLEGQVTTVYVQAASSEAITQIQNDLETVLPDSTVNTQADLASTVSGSLSTAASLVSSRGSWLSLLVLAAAFLLAILFTVSGVTRRTREFGTLKAIGWTNRRVVGQVAGESVVQGLIGGAVGVAGGIVGILVLNAIAPTLSASATAQTALNGRPALGDGVPGFAGPGMSTQVQTATEVALQAPLTGTIVLAAVGFAVLGGLLAGAIGGWRAARLRPAEALRSVA